LEHPAQTPVLIPGTKRATDGPEGYEPGDSARTAEACCEDTQSAGVKTRSRTGTSKPSRLIRVVRDDYERCVTPVFWGRRIEVEFGGHRAASDDLRQHPPPGSELCIPVGIRLHDLCVDAERSVV
jgi:hypothetical protein